MATRLRETAQIKEDGPQSFQSSSSSSGLKNQTPSQPPPKLNHSQQLLLLLVSKPAFILVPVLLHLVEKQISSDAGREPAGGGASGKRGQWEAEPGGATVSQQFLRINLSR